jgi:hypothetical protein
MKAMKLIVALMSAAVVAGCATVDTPSRNAPFTQASPSTPASLAGAAPVFEEAVPSYRVSSINVDVPRTLLVSEANSYKPRGDIVWRGDLPGDRFEQVKAIFDAAMATGTAGIQGDVPIIIDIQVTRFHALTEKTRYTVGGVHEIEFMLAIRSSETGLMLREPRKVVADLVGYGGQQAIDAERQGQTEKVRISAHLANVIRTELSQPGGFKNIRLGFFG